MIHKRAFSTIELLLVLVLFGVILSIAFSFNKGLINENRADVYAHELKATLNFARAAAIARGEIVELRASDARNGSWDNGQIVITNSGEVLRVLPKVSHGDILVWEGGGSSENSAIIFLPTGFPKGCQGAFRYCPKNNPENGRKITLHPSGRVRISKKDEKIGCNF